MACHTNVVWCPQLKWHSIWSFPLCIAVPPSGYLSHNALHYVKPFRSWIDFGLNVVQPNPLARDNKGIIILSLPLWSKCIWEGLGWTFSVSSSVVGRWSEHWGTGYSQFSDVSSISKVPQESQCICLSIHQPPTQLWDFTWLPSSIGTLHILPELKSQHLRHGLNLTLSLLSSKQLPTPLKLSPVLQMTLDKYRRVVFPLPKLSAIGSFSTATKRMMYTRKKHWSVWVKAEACCALRFTEVSFS